MDEILYNVIKKYLYDHISSYDTPLNLNKEIKIHNFKKINDNIIEVEYSYELISKVDSYWRKWYTSKDTIDISNLKDYIRDSKLKIILKEPD